MILSLISKFLKRFFSNINFIFILYIDVLELIPNISKSIIDNKDLLKYNIYKNFRDSKVL